VTTSFIGCLILSTRLRRSFGVEPEAESGDRVSGRLDQLFLSGASVTSPDLSGYVIHLYLDAVVTISKYYGRSDT
jgi:hypothetical protein